MSSRVKSAAARAVKTAALGVDRLAGPRRGPRILIYHDVGPDTGSEMAVTQTTLADQIERMRALGKIIGLDEAIAGRGEADADSSFVLTFDDGHRGVFDNAFAMLQTEGVPFTLYINTAPIEGSGPPRPGSGPMTWDELREMIDTGLVTIGAHTHRHTDLRHADTAEAEAEIVESNHLLETHLGVTPHHFAYPWGYWSATADPIVRRHYRSATLGSGPSITQDTDPYLLHRIPIQASDVPKYFDAKLRGGMRLEDRARRLVKGYRGP